MEYDRDRDHLNILGIMYYVSAGLTVLASLAGMVYLVVGILVLRGVIHPKVHLSGDQREVIGQFFTLLGVLVLGFLALGIANFLVGRCLRSGKERTFCFVVACLNLQNLPIGTLLGVFTLIVLSRQRVKFLFDGASEPPMDAAPGVAPENDNALAAPVDA